ncbi:hypothetical protein CEY09_31615 [Achromobacter marplatensis]|uniref:Phage protein n=1 Tax=Achromobacter marplatensis TaxID=470868 RepID=A0ABX9FV00_9BURK|nr:hypothetical protein [Achromobacter marplatensis]OWT53999.1 hypothetical protein CEY09_31615 [Achromobacter marplatensis]RBP09779.1 hypothetical protein DFP87_1338 [Achromobacter marplatensis]CAB3717108.1 hypothetical protein LMG26219_06305 [Achromobacter marplatensis]
MNTNKDWKMVPKRATKAMQDAWDTAPFNDDTDVEFHGAYAAMIAAAPASAEPERDWELTCEDCDGYGFVYVERRVGMCATDLQTFKEECECCDGRGFLFAFEDIPGIAGYVKSCRPASTVATEGEKDEQAAFERWLDRTCPSGDVEAVQRQWEASSDYADLHAPAAGDALPPLDDDLIEILGRPNFACVELATLLRAGGHSIKNKAEHEQAAVIHFLLGHYLKHGAAWHEHVGAAFEAIAQQSQQRKGDEA